MAETNGSRNGAMLVRLSRGCAAGRPSASAAAKPSGSPRICRQEALAVIMVPASSSVSTPDDRLPSTVSRYSPWAWSSARLSSADWLAAFNAWVMSLKELTRKPISFLSLVSTSRPKSPAATCRVALDSRDSGDTIRRAAVRAASIASRMVSNSTSDRISRKLCFRELRR